MLIDDLRLSLKGLRSWGLALLGFVALATFAYADQCLRCHARPDVFSIVNGRQVSLRVDEVRYRASAHHRLACEACHYGTHPSKQTVSCEECHIPGNTLGAPDFGEQIREYRASVHGRALANGNRDVARCADCHHPHYVIRLGPPDSIDEKRYVVSACSRCHAEPAARQANGALPRALRWLDLARERPLGRGPTPPEVVDRHGISPEKTARAYVKSVHGQALSGGDARAPACTDCHGLHRILPHTDPASTVARANVPTLCGRCHRGIADQYSQSIHGKAWAAGIRDAPVCTDCHGEHNILSPTEAESQVSPMHVTTTCSACHANARIFRRYHLPTRRLETYRESFHGVSAQFGDTRVANCASCHGAHDILPPSDPRSRISPANLPTTCGQCHPGATELFTRGTIHLDPSPRRDAGVYYVRAGYWVFIVGLMSLFVLSIALDLVSLRRTGFAPRRAKPLTGYERLSIHARIQHMVLIFSFCLLVFTGFPVLYHDSPLARAILAIVGGPIMRSALHRVGAVLLIGTSLYHLLIVLLTPQGRADFKAMLATRKDLEDIRDMYLFYLGKRAEKPSFDRFNYVEKFEYYALAWGTVVMTLSGLALTFEEAAMRILPKWAWDIVYAVHGYEALLAFLAIIIWHLYNVHLRPGIFPMNWAWIRGTMSEEHLREEHPVEYERWRRGRDEG